MEDGIVQPPRQAVYILSGIETGFRVGFNRDQPIHSMSKNCSSADAHPQVITEYIREEATAERYLGPIVGDQAQFVHISKFGVIPKGHMSQANGAYTAVEVGVPKPVPNLCTACVQAWPLLVHWRCIHAWTLAWAHVHISKQFPSLGTPAFTAVLITDLSSPAGLSVNDGINPTICSSTYITVNQVAAVAASLGVGSLLAKINTQSAYRIVPVHPQDRRLNLLTVNGITLAMW